MRMSSNWIMKPQGKNKQHLSCHHLAFFVPFKGCLLPVRWFDKALHHGKGHDEFREVAQTNTWVLEGKSPKLKGYHPIVSQPRIATESYGKWLVFFPCEANFLPGWNVMNQSWGDASWPLLTCQSWYHQICEFILYFTLLLGDLPSPKISLGGIYFRTTEKNTLSANETRKSFGPQVIRD